LGYLLKMFELEASPESSCWATDNVKGVHRDVEPSKAANFSTGPECTTVKRWAYYIAPMFKSIYSLQIDNDAPLRDQFVSAAKLIGGPNAAVDANTATGPLQYRTLSRVVLALRIPDLLPVFLAPIDQCLRGRQQAFSKVRHLIFDARRHLGK